MTAGEQKGLTSVLFQVPGATGCTETRGHATAAVPEEGDRESRGRSEAARQCEKNFENKAAWQRGANDLR